MMTVVWGWSLNGPQEIDKIVSKADWRDQSHHGSHARC
jgi:hypothetical protein